MDVVKYPHVRIYNILYYMSYDLTINYISILDPELFFMVHVQIYNIIYYMLYDLWGFAYI
jgi:hypothetical protein